MLKYFLETKFAIDLPQDCIGLIVSEFIKNNPNICRICYHTEIKDLEYIDGAGYVCHKCFYI